MDTEDRREDTEDSGELKERGEREDSVQLEERGEREDNVQLEERGEREDSVQLEEREVHIYASADDIISGPPEDMRDNTAGRHTQVDVLCVTGQSSKTVMNPLEVVAVCLGMLGLILIGVIIGQAVKHHSDNDQTNYGNLTLEREQLVANLTLKITLLQSEVNQLKKADHSDNDQTNYGNLTLKIDLLESEVNQLKKADKSCPSGWKRFECSCYYGSTETSTEDKTWDESRAECLKTGAHLVIINSDEEKEFIQGFNKDGLPSWIGLNRTGVKWTWVDGIPLTTKYWIHGQLAHEDRDCAFKWHGGLLNKILVNKGWYNWMCSFKLPWICEKTYLS